MATQIEGRVTSVSWIPPEAMNGAMRVPMDLGIGHYDDPPPDRIPYDDVLTEWQRDDRFRFANHLRGVIDVEDGKVTGARHHGGGLIGETRVRVSRASLTVQAVPYPDRRPEITLTDTSATFVQTAGGRTGAPFPRKVSKPPFIRMVAPTAWTTLSLTLHADGRVEHEVVSASPFPRHWIYDTDGALCQKSGLISYDSWAREQRPDDHPWANDTSTWSAVVTDVESDLERHLSARIMRAEEKPHLEEHEPGTVLCAQGEASTSLMVLLDGVLRVDVDGEPVTEIGPGAVVGERAILEQGRRTATLVAVTKVRIAIADAEQIDLDRLAELATHRRVDLPETSD